MMSDISTSIIARHESGESYEAIMKDMGTPRQVAERFNAAMGVSDKPSRWRFYSWCCWFLLVIGVIVKISYEQGTLAGVSLMQGNRPVSVLRRLLCRWASSAGRTGPRLFL